MQPVSSAYSTALEGVRASQAKALEATKGIASGDLDNLAGNLASLMSARTMQAANLNVISRLDEMDKDVLDILA